MLVNALRGIGFAILISIITFFGIAIGSLVNLSPFLSSIATWGIIGILAENE